MERKEKVERADRILPFNIVVEVAFSVPVEIKIRADSNVNAARLPTIPKLLNHLTHLSTLRRSLPGVMVIELLRRDDAETHIYTFHRLGTNNTSTAPRPP